MVDSQWLHVHNLHIEIIISSLKKYGVLLSFMGENKYHLSITGFAFLEAPSESGVRKRAIKKINIVYELLSLKLLCAVLFNPQPKSCIVVFFSQMEN